ncbi:hypothetical protein HBI25_139790 [Parastagonospora nodorum]|nr:hypothetical protein HBH51_114010 [Parastagonospora nodorum]KAH4028604.1 hypothetical protein HBI09_139370 [Parastagonospora nodorum]KAH4105024.1 hypothetical protein HBH46_090860 [Parastagonospora nodorum]KAH4189731.1 hypothetical protein HBH42_135060 [Parastagonospora nodorum]KAH4206603.1 hypothetical protein HBI95_117830 [Parastagonospora nodorum]
MVRISIDGKLFTVDNTVAKSWLPNANSWSHIRGDDIVDAVENSLSARSQTSIAPSTVRKVIRDLFQTLSRHHHRNAANFTTETLQSLLHEDKYGNQLSGLKASRSHFLILAALARCTHSIPLAIAIASFLSNNIHDVVQYESHYYLREWNQALHELHGVFPDPHMLQQLIAQLTGCGRSSWSPHKWYDSDATKMKKAIEAAQSWPRIPSPRMIGPPLDLGRPLSAPGYRCPRIPSPDWRLNRWYRSAWSSPVMQPRIPDYCDDEGYEALAVEQECQAAEMDDMNRRLKRLENSSPYSSNYYSY